jgi:hypothetical protein
MTDATSKEVFAGSAVEIDGSGDYLINTTEALNGDIRMKLSEGRAVVIEIAGEPVFEVAQQGGKVRIDLGGAAAERLVLGDSFMALFNQLLATFNTHTHATSTGPSGPPIPPFTQTMGDAHLSSIARTKKE